MRFSKKILAMSAIFFVLTDIEVRNTLFAQEDAVWKERFLREAPLAWDKYKERAKRLQGSIERTTIRLTPQREVSDRDRCEIKQRNGCALFLAQGLGSGKKPDTKGLAMCINSRYGFEVRRRTPTSPWFAVNLDVDLSDGMAFQLGSPPPIGAVAFWAACSTTFDLIPSFSWDGINDPGFHLHRVTYIPQKERQAVKIEFDYSPPTGKSKIPSLKGWVLYDPDSFWVISEYNVQAEWVSTKIKALTAVTYEYEQTADDFPIPKRVIRRFTPESGVNRESQYVFDLKEADVPESEFTLSAFGLLEPPLPERPFPWFWLFAASGTVCLGFFFFLRARARRLRFAG